MKPILFNTDMTRAVLDGRKTVTRRVVKPQPKHFIVPDRKERKPMAWWVDNERWAKPPYHPGDILYIPEPWKCRPDSQLWDDDEYRVIFKDGEVVRFYFEEEERREKWQKYIYKPTEQWQSPYFMPREAARIFLRVTKVYPQQLKDVAGADAKAEGFNLRAEFVGVILGMYPDCTEESWFWVNEFERISKEEANRDRS